MKKPLIFLLLITLPVTTLLSQNKKWTLRECVEHALENNISVKQSELDIEQADIDKSDAIGNFLPSLNGQASNSWNTGLTQNVVTNTFETQQVRNSVYSVTAGLNLFSGMRNIRTLQRAQLSQLAAEYGLSKMKDDISLFVANAYLSVLTNKANLAVAISQNEVTQEQIKLTMDRVDAGVLPRGDLLEIQATDATEKQQITIAENQVRISLISLAQLLLIEDYQNFDIVDEGYEIIDDGISKKDVSEIISAAEENRSEVKIAQTNLDLAMKDLQIARSSYYPTLTAFINYNTRETDATQSIPILDPNNPFLVTDTQIGVVNVNGLNEPVFGLAPNVIGSTDLEPPPFGEQLYLNDGISYGFQLNVPIFNGLSTRNNVKRSKVNIKRQENLLEQARLDLESNVYQAYVDAQGAYKAFEAAQKALSSQELAYEYARERYDVGLTNAFDFSQSKLRYDNARIELNRSKYDYIFRLKVLELYFGIPATELKI